MTDMKEIEVGPGTPEARARAVADDVAAWAAANPNAGEVLFLLGRCHAALLATADDLEVAVGVREPDQVIDARKRIETPGDFIEWLDGIVDANGLLGVQTLLDSGIVDGERVLFLMLDGETLMTLNTKLRLTVAAHPPAEEGGAHA